MKKRRILKLAGITIFFYIVISIAAGAFVAGGALHPPRRRQPTSTDIENEIVRTHDENAVLNDVYLDASDGAVLRAWDIRPARPNGSAVIVLHGLSDNRIGMEG